jgi:hypothetical protein
VIYTSCSHPISTRVFNAQARAALESQRFFSYTSTKPLIVISITRGLKPRLLCRVIYCSTSRTSMFHGTGSVRKRRGQRGTVEKNPASGGAWSTRRGHRCCCSHRAGHGVQGRGEDDDEWCRRGADRQRWRVTGLPSNLELPSLPPWNPSTSVAPL